MAVLECGRFGLWPFWSVAVLVWPFWFVAVLVVAVLVCRRFDQTSLKANATRTFGFSYDNKLPM